MNKRFIIMLTTALCLALFAAWIANIWIQARPTTTTVPLVAAAVDIPYGAKIQDFQLKLIDWPGSSVPNGYYSSKEQVIDKIAKNDFYADEVISEKRMFQHSVGSTLSTLIQKDYRAISVRVDDVVGVSGFILPGNNVDILATKMDRTVNQAITETKLQNIKVLAVDQDDSHEKDKPAIVRAVTLELKPEQAEIMVKAMQEGTIQLTLRNPEDSQFIDVSKKVAAIPSRPSQQKTPVKIQRLRVIPW